MNWLRFGQQAGLWFAMHSSHGLAFATATGMGAVFEGWPDDDDC